MTDTTTQKGYFSLIVSTSDDTVVASVKGNRIDETDIPLKAGLFMAGRIHEFTLSAGSALVYRIL